MAIDPSYICIINDEALTGRCLENRLTAYFSQGLYQHTVFSLSNFCVSLPNDNKQVKDKEEDTDHF